MKPKIALVITDRESNAQIKAIKPDLLEIRVDLFKSIKLDYVVDQIKSRRALKIPLLLTVRNQKEEGAVKKFSNQNKLDIIENCLPLVNLVDIELSSPILKAVCMRARELKKKVIVSTHNFKETPSNLNIIFKKALSTRADIVKIAAKAKSWDDVLRMIEFTHKHSKHSLITMSLGQIGAISRVILPAAGSQYTYTFLNKPTAPGQIDAKTLQAHLKFYYS